MVVTSKGLEARRALILELGPTLKGIEERC